MKVYGRLAAPLAFVSLLLLACPTVVAAQDAAVQKNKRETDGQASEWLRPSPVEERGWIEDVGSFFSEKVPVMWGKVVALGGEVGDFTKSKLEDAKKQLEDTSQHIEDLQDKMQPIITASKDLHVEVLAKADQHAFTIEDFSKELSCQCDAAMEELQETSPPLDKELGHDNRVKLAETIFNKAEEVLVFVGTKFGIAESAISAFCEVTRPNFVQLVTLIGDIVEQHPLLVEIVLSSVLGFVAGEVAELWILLSLLRLFGFGPAGPIKGGVAAWIQKAFFGKAIPAGGWFATLQRLGMTGGKGSPVGAITGAIGGAVGAVAIAASKQALEDA